ncbi:MAG TPA: PspA/IM30 family protein [Methylococcaceae bacterium]|jgi:phage shock protein A|nr:PspA/IM30 family protein [Methylococcaceae bacterium]HIA45874.1 PspA/IM30 family protein [Methylococcaceae bacterium]HIB62991.1 PspA/IM30 family protein [Methylococcaceae bacterium]HIN68245.1 PspA/IM30 family protein [Methylococcales bacterium]
MSILKSIMTAIRGGVSEVGEAVVDANAVRILEQEIREAGEALAKAKTSLTSMKGNEISLNRMVNTLNEDIVSLESKVMACLEKGEEALATEVAERIAEKESERNELKTEYDTAKVNVNKVNKMIKGYEKKIQKNKRDLDKVKTVEQLQKATSAISSNISASGSADNKISAALERVKAKQQKFEDNLEAGDWMETQGDDLEARLADAGIGENSASAKSVLARLKSQKQEA